MKQRSLGAVVKMADLAECDPSPEAVIAESSMACGWRLTAVVILREAAAAITRPMGELLPTSIPGAYSMAHRVPYGVVGACCRGTRSLVLGIRSIAIPLAVGNTVVMKPSEDAPITCGLLLADVLAEAGLPPGVLNVVTNDLADAGDVVAAHRRPASADGQFHGLDQRRAHHRGPGR